MRVRQRVDQLANNLGLRSVYLEVLQTVQVWKRHFAFAQSHVIPCSP